MTFLADQALKLWIVVIYDLAARGRVAVLPGLDLVMVWNRGISYGMFQQDGLYWPPRSAGAVGCGLRLSRVLAQAARFTAPGHGLGLILGGAAGNAVDRAVYGAVADFVLLHAGDFEWYVFNIADAAIVVGVILVLYGALRRNDRAAAA